MAHHDDLGDGATRASQLSSLLTRWRWVVYLVLLILAFVLIEATREPRASGTGPSGHGASTQR